MRPKVLKWEVIILCVILFFPGISLNAQEVRQDDIYEIRQSSFSRYGFDTLSVHTPHRFIHRLARNASEPSPPFSLWALRCYWYRKQY